MLLVGFIIGAVVVGMIGAFLLERREWNGGFCRENGKRWVRFDNDSQGGRGYKSGAYTLWISYPFVEKESLHNLERD